MKSGDLELQLELYSCVCLIWAKMITVVYAEEARFLTQRVILRNSEGDRHKEFPNAVSELVHSPWAEWLTSGPRTFLWCCKFLSEHSFHPLVIHSRFVQLSGLLLTDPAPQGHELLCRTIELVLTLVQLQGAELFCFQLLARRAQLLEMKFRDKVAGFLFGGSVEEDSHIYPGTGPTRGLLVIASELEGMRPSELCNLTVGQVIHPLQGSGASSWALPSALLEEVKASKTGKFDESVLFDGHLSVALGKVLA